MHSVQKAFQKQKWEFQQIQADVIESFFEGYHTKIRIHAQVFSKINVLHIISSTRISIPKTYHNKLLQLINKANSQLTLGNFEYKKNHLIFRAANLFAQSKYQESVIASLVHSAIAEIDHLSACVSVLGNTPFLQIEEISLQEILERAELYPPNQKTENA